MYIIYIGGYCQPEEVRMNTNGLRAFVHFIPLWVWIIIGILLLFSAAGGRR